MINDSPIFRMEKSMIMSLDCSTTCIGWAIFDEDDLITYGRLEPTKGSLDWKGRVDNLIYQLDELIDKYKPTQIYQEQVPMGGSGGATILSKLFYLQGALYVIETLMNKIPVTYITVGQWRHDIGIGTGDKNRDSKKIKSIEKANELFDVKLEICYTKNGTFKESGSDDISDAILIYASTRDKYKYKKPTVKIGRGRKVVG